MGHAVLRQPLDASREARESAVLRKLRLNERKAAFTDVLLDALEDFFSRHAASSRRQPRRLPEIENSKVLRRRPGGCRNPSPMSTMTYSAPPE